MKQLFSLTIAAILGGIITLSGFQFLNKNNSNLENRSFAKQVNNVNVKPQFTNTPFNFTEAAEKAMPAVVHISAKESEKMARDNRGNDPFLRFFGDDLFFGNPYNTPKQGSGSGVIYSEDGYIITNNHVVEFADEIEVTTYDNRKFPAKIIGTYPASDLAVLKIEAGDLKTLRISNSDDARIGEWVLAVGNPLDLTSTVTAGIISAKGRDIDIIQTQNELAIESFIQTDAAVNPGNSGGALVDVNGELLGINTAIATKTGYFQGYSFAIPVNIVTNIVDDIIENGSYERGFLGINIAELTKEDISELNLSISQGVLVDNVVDRGAAQYAGVLPNDVIVEANAKKIRSTPDLLEILGSAKVGETVNLKINRSGKILDVPVRLKASEPRY
ncbi:trypsin-like peptidase domain-containing protein [Saprospiraceae bacterium]|jgi:Do/DeqQ family serine protease|nr:trypsin-like peptidase domain-containing protein [Bacteroidota bacterium]MDB4727257.1 trypsin-like peptidase domain-containing protein [Saprospiraceae bacterium]MDF1864547.1 trypsin-like peptidase domain-containing protein [Saprospiraceae bacterium]